MPNQKPLISGLTVEDLTAAIMQWLDDDDRSVSWLAKKIGVADSTLRFQLYERPDRLLTKTWLAMVTALGRDWDDVRAAVKVAS